MLARDIMTSPVISVSPDTPVRDIAALLRDRRIGGVPVLQQGRLVGMVTEADLLHRVEIGTDQVEDRRHWWERIGRSDPSAHNYVKSHGQTARLVMSTGVHSVPPDLPLSELATHFDRHGIERTAVVEADRMVGIIARADLVKALTRWSQAAAATPGSDEAIRSRLEQELEHQPWWNTTWSTVHVERGTVIFKGVVEHEAGRLAARVAAENIAGVRWVRDDRVLASDFPVMM